MQTECFLVSFVAAVKNIKNVVEKINDITSIHSAMNY